MSAINEFKIVGTVSQNAVIKKTKNNKIAYCVLKPINSDLFDIPVIAFGDCASRLNYCGRKDNILQVLGNITSTTINKRGKKSLRITLVANEIDVYDIKQKTIVSNRDFTDLFKLYDLPKYNPPKRR